ncbi:hypothetical protein GYA19_04150 [Candidatus Beckwithbacteria bacterium]|nr:hypothetical protein [Candidatus Beckwithbacteria bacterium]
MKKIFKFFKILPKVYHNLIVNKQQEINFWILYSFVLTFIAARLVVIYFLPGQEIQDLPLISLFNISIHIHHFVVGVLLLAITSFALLHDLDEHHKKIFACFYGIGLGLIMDEFGMIIHLNEYYYFRLSYDAVMVVGSLFFSFVYFKTFWNTLFKIGKKYLIPSFVKLIKLPVSFLKK